jgi:hyperosmotically inducible protein
MGTPADQAIARQVEQAIGFNPRVNVFDVRVEVRDGVALLQGIVQNLDAKMAAGEAAAATPGVRRVDNALTVEDPRGLASTEIDGAVEEALEEAGGVNSQDVGAHVTDSIAHLVGHVDSVDDEQAAIHAASRAEGVKDVVSELDISPGRDVDWVDIKNAVTDALDAAGGFNPYAIDVNVETGGRVVLSGSAASERDRERAVRIAGRVDGVKEVVDRLSG